MRVLMPIRLDRFQSPITTLLRAVVEASPSINFFSYSDPLNDEDKELGEELWKRENLTKARLGDLIGRRYDIVHHASATRFGLRSGRMQRNLPWSRASYVFTANCQPYGTHPNRDLLLKCASVADCVVPVSRVVATDFERELGISCSEVIPNGFDPDLYQIPSLETLPDSHDISSEHQGFVLYTSAFLDRKHPHLFLDLMERLPDLKGVMVGSIPDQKLYHSVKERATELGNVEVLGLIARRELRDLMQRAGLLLYTSEYEGFPLTLIEAMGCGVPIIARPESSMPELIEHGVNGWLYDIKDLSPWLSKTREILSWDAETRSSFATRARKSVVNSYSWESIGLKYAELYRQLRS